MTDEETTMVRKHANDQQMPELTDKVKAYLRNAEGYQRKRKYEFGKLAKKSLDASNQYIQVDEDGKMRLTPDRPANKKLVQTSNAAKSFSKMKESLT